MVIDDCVQDTSVKGAALALAQWPKENASRPRMVVITQGSKATMVVEGSKVTSFDVPPMKPEEIVDSNGAGDAFVGGFLSQLVQGAPTERCVQAGHYAARTILGVSGTVLTGKPAFA